MRIINKALNSNLKQALQIAVDRKYSDGYGWVLDNDETYVYFELYVDGSYQDYKAKYSYDDKTATIEGERSAVVSKRVYEDVEEPLTKSSVLSILKEFVCLNGNVLPVIKQLNDEQMIAIEPLYIAAGEVDLHGDTISLSETESMVESFNKALEEGVLQTALFHNHKTECFTINKAWVNPVECMIGEVAVAAGQPLVEIQFSTEEAWELRKEGRLMGLSIGAQAVGEVL